MPAESPSSQVDAPFGLLGRTLGHSWSPAIHTELGSAPYELFEREPEDVESFVRAGSWRGINVTIPYKRRAFELADEASVRARRLGVANTLVRRPDGSIYADNTDYAGFAWMLDRFARRVWGAPAEGALAGTRALVLGSGGASQAVQAALSDAGAHVTVISRTGANTYDTLVERQGDTTLVVNATPVGMCPTCPASPLSRRHLDGLPHLGGILDVVYNPLRTGLCLMAEERGIPCESGLAMLVGQAVRSSELFQGGTIPGKRMDALVASLRARRLNVALIGMPGSGKSSTGRSLARLMRRPFVDLDEAIRLRQASPEDIIKRDGEDAFRAIETAVASNYGARSGMVIACGGGIVTRPENYWLLHQNATIVLIRRPLDELSSEGRPLSISRGIEALAAERTALYERWADVTIDCTGSAASDAQLIQRLLSHPSSAF